MDGTRKPPDLASWASALEAEIGEIVGQIEPLQERLQKAKSRLELVGQLIELEGGDSPAPALSRSNLSAAGPAAEQPVSNVAAPAVRSSDVAATVTSILEEHKVPMHINDIRQIMIDAGAPLPGRGDVANIIVHINKPETGIIRTGRGTYALRSWGLDEVPPAKRKTVRKKARRK